MGNGCPVISLPMCPYFDVERIGRLTVVRKTVQQQTNVFAAGTTLNQGDKITLFTTAATPTLRAGQTVTSRVIDTPRRGCQLLLVTAARGWNPAGWPLPAFWPFLAGRIQMFFNDSSCPDRYHTSFIDAQACVTCDAEVTALGATSALGTLRAFIGTDICCPNIEPPLAYGSNDVLSFVYEYVGTDPFVFPEETTYPFFLCGYVGGADGDECILNGSIAPGPAVTCEEIATRPDAVASGAVQVVGR